eukprot:14552094-Alexandrium_andersonii.AAC.1
MLIRRISFFCALLIRPPFASIFFSSEFESGIVQEQRPQKPSFSQNSYRGGFWSCWQSTLPLRSLPLLLLLPPA